MTYPEKMTPQEHAKIIAKEAGHLIYKKYMVGHKVNGGKLWEKEGMLDNAIEEVVDLMVYLLTLKQQLEKTIKH